MGAAQLTMSTSEATSTAKSWPLAAKPSRKPVWMSLPARCSFFDRPVSGSAAASETPEPSSIRAMARSRRWWPARAWRACTRPMVSIRIAGACSMAIERNATSKPSSCSASIGGSASRSMANPPAWGKASATPVMFWRPTRSTSTARGCSKTRAGWRFNTAWIASSAFFAGVMVSPDVRQGMSGSGRARDWTSSERPSNATVSTVW